MTTTSSLTDQLLGWIQRISEPSPPPPRPRVTGWPGLYLGAGRVGPLWGGPQHHALVIGPPRAGKTTRLAVPNLLAHPGPALATSTKADLMEASAARRAARGTCWLWDPTGTLTPPESTRPLRWSPIVGCHIWDQAVTRAHALATAARPGPARYATHGSELHWIERAQALLAPLLHAAAVAPTDLAALLGWLHRRDLVEPLSVLDTHHAQVAADLLTGLAATDPRELSGIFSTADSILAPYRTDATLRSAAHPNFDPATFVKSNDTVYLTAPTTSQALYAPLVVALLDQIRAHTYTASPHPSLLWVLDELANIAPLPELPAIISEGASQGLLVLACLQDLSQARARWDTAADGFLTLFTHKLVLPGIADLATLKQLSALAGEIDIPAVGHTRENKPLGKSSTTTNPQRRPRLPLDAIATGVPGHALWLRGTQLTSVALPYWK